MRTYSRHHRVPARSGRQSMAVNSRRDRRRRHKRRGWRSNRTASTGNRRRSDSSCSLRWLSAPWLWFHAGQHQQVVCVCAYFSVLFYDAAQTLTWIQRNIDDQFWLIM